MDFIDPDSIGIIEPTGLMWEPYGETPYLELIAIYSEKGFQMKSQNVKAFHIKEMNSLSETRAAVLGLRQTGLPIHVSMAVDGYGVSIHGADILACLVVLQGLSIKSFGLRCTDNEDIVASVIELVEKLVPHAKIPLTVTLDSSIEALSDDELTEFILSLLKMGITAINLTSFVDTRQALIIRSIQNEFDYTICDDIEHEELENIAACTEHTFYLRDDMVHSELIECHYNMGDHIIGAEDEGAEVLVFDVPTTEDAYRFGLHCHLARVPVAIRSDSDEALEAALVLYNGIAIIDCLSDISDDIKETLANGYNALIR